MPVPAQKCIHGNPEQFAQRVKMIDRRDAAPAEPVVDPLRRAQPQEHLDLPDGQPPQRHDPPDIPAGLRGIDERVGGGFGHGIIIHSDTILSSGRGVRITAQRARWRRCDRDRRGSVSLP